MKINEGPQTGNNGDAKEREKRRHL